MTIIGQCLVMGRRKFDWWLVADGWWLVIGDLLLGGSMIRHYRDLQVWQRAMDVAVTIYELTKS